MLMADNIQRLAHGSRVNPTEVNCSGRSHVLMNTLAANLQIRFERNICSQTMPTPFEIRTLQASEVEENNFPQPQSIFSTSLNRMEKNHMLF